MVEDTGPRIWTHIASRLIDKFASKKFFAAVGAFVIIVMHASGAEVDPTILKMAGGTLLAYPGVEAVVDIVRAPKRLP